jgi:hypothetical protein
MNGTTYAVLAYAIGLALLWGYAISMWIEARRTAKVSEGEKP